MKEVVYLRKSQSDDPDEPLEITLAKHKTRILQLIGSKDVDWYEEVVSADSIAERPKIQELLRLINEGVYTKLYCIHIDRLCRGDSIDQGIIAQTIFYSGCLIVTPEKTYDLANSETDRDMFDFSLFIAKREHNLIKKRLFNGKIDAVMAGYFVGSVTPFGYDKELDKKTKKNYILIYNEKEKEIVETIFDLFLNKDLSRTYIANYLNELGVKGRKSDVWTPSMIRNILTNENYIGILYWEKSITIRKMDGNRIIKQRKYKKDFVRYRGKHKPIIDEETFNKVQLKIKNHPLSKVINNKELKNPLAGLVVCSSCGRTMQRRPNSTIKTSIRRKYKINKEELLELLRTHKKASKLTKQQIADELDISKYIVDNWFNKNIDKFFISEHFSNKWFELKKLLNITTDKFDKSITTYEVPSALVTLLCTLSVCNNISCELKSVENKLLEAISKRLEDYKYFLNNYEEEIEKVIRGNIRTLESLNNKIDKKKIEYKNNYKNFNSGDVNKDIYLEVKIELEEELEKLEHQKSKIEENKQEDKIIIYKKNIPILEKCLNQYHTLDPKEKNELLHSIIEKAIYTKTKRGSKTNKTDFELEIFFKI